LRKKAFVIILLLVSMLFSSVFLQSALADSRHDEVVKYVINVKITPDGNADIEERITYKYTGDFNGTYRNVDYARTGGIENIEVFVEKNGFLEKWALNSTTNLDENSGPGTYNLVLSDEIARFKIFEKSSNEEKTYVIRYTFRDVVTKYNDTAEFNRKIVDSNWSVVLKNISINISLPSGAQKDELKVFGHGPLIGESKIIDGENVQFTIDYINPGSGVETLVLFPTRLVPDASNVVSKDALPEIMENEKRLAEEANRQREEAKKQVEEYEKRRQAEEERRRKEEARIAVLKQWGNSITLVFLFIWFIPLVYLYRKYDKELKPTFEGKYYRELPGEYTPAEMSSLLSMGPVGTRDITATLMDLIRKEQLILKTKKYIKKGLFKDKEITDYVVFLNPNAPTVALKRHELFLMDWFIGTIGDGNSVALDDISDYAKTTSRARKFKMDYDKWCRLAMDEAERNNFFDSASKKGRTYGCLAALLYLLLGVIVCFGFKSGAGIVLMVQFFILLIFSARINRRTQYGSEQKAMWMAFKNFLKEFSHLDRAEIPSIVIWEHYLVYAISLGVAKEVISQLPIVFTDEDLQNAHLTYMYGYQMHNFAVFSDAFDRTVASVDSAISNAMAVANSKLSSSSGGGGGFSGGSSGGGGGRGGGGSF